MHTSMSTTWGLLVGPSHVFVMVTWPSQRPWMEPQVHGEQPRLSSTSSAVSSRTGNAAGHSLAPSTQMQSRSPFARGGMQTCSLPQRVGAPKVHARCDACQLGGDTATSGIGEQPVAVVEKGGLLTNRYEPVDEREMSLHCSWEMVPSIVSIVAHVVS